MRFYFILAMLLAVPVSTQADTYFWEDSSGNAHYGDQRPETEAARIELKKFSAGADADNADLPYETRRAMERFPVTLYTANNCITECAQARELLNKRGIPFVEKVLLKQEDIDNFIKETASDQTPTLSVGKLHLKGFEAGQWNSELDSAGYPRIAPYRPAKTKPAPAKVSPPEPESEAPDAEIATPEAEPVPAEEIP